MTDRNTYTQGTSRGYRARLAHESARFMEGRGERGWETEQVGVSTRSPSDPRVNVHAPAHEAEAIRLDDPAMNNEFPSREA